MEQPNWKMFILPIVILFVFIGGIIGIINWQKSKKVSFPTLTVDIDEKGLKVKDKNFTITGKTDPKNKVTVNTEEAEVEKDGNFSKPIVLKSGENEFGIKAENKGGQTTVLSRTVTYSTTPSRVQKPAAKPETSESVQTGTANGVQTPSSLTTSGPEDFILPAVGFSGLVLMIAVYLKSKKQLANSLRK